MTTSSEVPQEFLDAHDLGDGWELRFTADEYRAREIAEQYREMGHVVALIPLAPGEETPGVEQLKEFGDDLDVQHDPLQNVENENCAPCLDETYALFTKENGDENEGSKSNLDESLYTDDGELT